MGGSSVAGAPTGAEGSNRRRRGLERAEEPGIAKAHRSDLLALTARREAAIPEPEERGARLIASLGGKAGREEGPSNLTMITCRGRWAARKQLALGGAADRQLRR